MVNYEDHRIVQNLDNPKRVLYWTMDEVGIVMLPLVMGILLGQFFLWITISIVGLLTLKRVKRKIGGRGMITRAMYWYLSVRNKDLKRVPPSHIREFIG
jgi:type IV conjugative transfer system protein TraL